TAPPPPLAPSRPRALQHRWSLAPPVPMGDAPKLPPRPPPPPPPPPPLRSRTRFGAGAPAPPRGPAPPRIPPVNQRFPALRARLPGELADLPLCAEQIARERLRRGRVELLVHTEGAVLSPCALDKDRARAAFRALSELRDELAPGAEVPLSLLAAVPDLFT